MPAKPSTRIAVRWTDNLAFDVIAGDRHIVADGDSRLGLSPVELLGAALAACMAADVAHILTRARQPLTSLDVSLSADRADTDPHRFVRIRLHVAAGGAVNPAQLERAVALSHEKYCSVWHSMRQDIPLQLTSTVTHAA
jgi:putative redox protein